MTTAELLTALAWEYPNGVSFDPMALRLLRQKVPFEDWQIEDLKAAMFQLGSGLWFSREMISDHESQLAFDEQAMEWLMEHGCFSVERLLEGFRGVFRHIATLEDCAALLRHLGFTVVAWGKVGHFCSQPPPSLDDSLAAISETIAGWLEEADGTLTFHEIEQTMPHLTAEALEGIRAQFLTEVHAAEVGGVPCWCSTEAIHLPEDFSEKLTTVVDTLVALEEKVSTANLEFALNLFYHTHFREEYALTDNDTFMRVCVKHYQGGKDVFPNKRKPGVRASDSPVPGRRVRSPNTRFRNIDVPIGAELVFTTDSHITCTVLDDSNKVEYGGKVWAISALAMHLLGVSSANGFYHFSYEGETLWERRLRLGREDEHDEYQTEEMKPPPEVQEEKKGGIIGLEGRPLSSSTWRLFRSAGTAPRVAEWARRVENGESVENIASENGLSVSTVKQYIRRYRYFVISEKNDIAPEGGDEYQAEKMLPPAEAPEGKQDEYQAVEMTPPVPRTRPHSPKTLFHDLGVPVGSRLFFTKDRHISCMVLDSSNKVEYQGETWTISRLAKHLSGISVAYGLMHFRYKSETLWERRYRLERQDKQDEYQTEEMKPPLEVQEEKKGEIIGLDGRPLSPSSWRLFRSAATSPRVAKWAERLENGESLENIAGENDLTVSTVKEYIGRRDRYFIICEKNDIVPEDGADV